MLNSGVGGWYLAIMKNYFYFYPSNIWLTKPKDAVSDGVIDCAINNICNNLYLSRAFVIAHLAFGQQQKDISTFTIAKQREVLNSDALSFGQPQVKNRPVVGRSVCR